MKENIMLLYIDLFCGAGGTSTGVENATVHGSKCAKVIACVDKDANAVASHEANHPDTLHITGDIRTLDLTRLVMHTIHMKLRYPYARLVLWASLECTNFSKAKGGKPRDYDSRALAEHLFRYIEALRPDYIQIENVAEFMSWGDIDENGHPISKEKGKCYIRWVNKLCSYGYGYDYRILSAADYGAYTSRSRYFGQFARHGLPTAFPKATHAKCPAKCEHSLFPAENMKPWKPVREVLDLEDEGESIFGRKKPLVEKTLERIYAGLIKFVTGGKEAFIVKYNSVNGKTGKYIAPSIDEPCPTVATQNRIGVANVQFMSKQFDCDQAGKNISVEEHACTITCRDHHAFVSSKYIMNPQFANKGGSIDKPCFTLIARMDKMPPYLVSTKKKGLAIEVYETDSPATIQIKEFMALYGITDIRMRMLRIHELKRIMGFPEDYILIGTQSEQKNFIGNAVEVNMSRVLCEAICKSLSNK